MDKTIVNEYFTKNCSSWLESGYGEKASIYGNATHRNKVTIKSIAKEFGERNILHVDLGCGGGNLCRNLVKMGAKSIGVDASENMIQESIKKKEELSVEEQNKIEFINKPLNENGLTDSYFDVVTSLGVIGYLDNDEELFSEAKRLLKKEGLFILSSRNRLFNMFSISPYTIEEIKKGDALKLIEEIEELYSSISKQEYNKFIEILTNNLNIINKIENQKTDTETSEKAKVPDLLSFKPRQHTPKELKRIAELNGFEFVQYYGIHPHLLIPRLNYILPSDIYNILSDSLTAFEESPMSLIWSSCLVGVFKKK